jgi:YNFM family putative membrane transporter
MSLNLEPAPVASGARISRSQPDFWRAAAPLAFGGFSTFALLYNVQPLMPLFASDLAISPATASLSLSVTTIVLAIAMLGAGAVADAFGRKRVMAISIAASSLATLLGAAAPNWPSFLAFRALAGLTLAGLPAVAMAYLADELDMQALGLGTGLYIAGSTLGGMAGRLIAAAISDHWGWRPAVATAGALGFFGAVLIALYLPRERPLAPRAGEGAGFFAALARPFADPGLRLLYAEAFLLMGVFVCAYNYIGFRLAAAPFSLSQTTIGWIFVLYLLGAVSSTVTGDFAGRYGRRRVMWVAVLCQLLGIAITFPDNLAAVIGGIALLTWGFFGAHSIASSWVGLRAASDRAHAAALYLFFYYLGSSLVGWGGGVFYARGHWPAVAALLIGLSAIALLVALRLSKVAPPRHLARR